MLGKPGDGWRVSLTTLMNERVSIGGAIPAKGSGVIRDLVKTWQALPEDRKDPATRDEVMKLWSRAEILRLTNIRANQNRKMGDPGPEGSIGKGASAELNKDVYNLIVDLMGADGMLYGSYAMTRPEQAMGFDSLQKAFPSDARQLDRGRHHRGDEEHPRRAHPRSARRRPRRPRSSVERGSPQLVRCASADHEPVCNSTPRNTAATDATAPTAPPSASASLLRAAMCTAAAAPATIATATLTNTVT